MSGFCSSQIPLPSGANVFTGGLALLAFVMALYTLAAREQKTPYIANSVYSTALIVLAAILFSTVGQVFSSTSACLVNIFGIFGVGLLGYGIVLVFFRVWQVQNRRVNFRDDQLVKNIKLVRQVKNFLRDRRNQPTYEHNAVGLGESLLKSIRQCLSISEDQSEETAKDEDGFAFSSVACRVSTLTEADHRLVKLAVCFLEKEYWVQYSTCTRHPLEFVLQLKKMWQNRVKEKDWQQIADHVVVVDAYSPHFGFTDSIHRKATKRLSSLGVECITSKASYAGVHTAAARAFNTIKDRAKKRQVREPTLVIYDGLHALVELESSEQYRIFIRHLIPSERLWGGMFTCVVESAIGEQDLALLKAYADLFIDLAEGDGTPRLASNRIQHAQNNKTLLETTQSAGDRK